MSVSQSAAYLLFTEVSIYNHCSVYMENISLFLVMAGFKKNADGNFYPTKNPVHELLIVQKIYPKFIFISLCLFAILLTCTQTDLGNVFLS